MTTTEIPFALTPMQRSCLQVICELMDRNGVAPSYDELAVELELKSKSGVSRLMQGLEKRGGIRRLSRHGRAITVLHRPPMPACDETFELSAALRRPTRGCTAHSLARGQGRAFDAGFCHAMLALADTHHSAPAVLSDMMAGAGYTLDDFEAAGIDAADLLTLRVALAGGAPQ